MLQKLFPFEILNARLIRGLFQAAVPMVLSGAIPLPPQYAWIPALLAGAIAVTSNGMSPSDYLKQENWPLLLLRGLLSAAAPMALQGQIPVPAEYAWIFSLVSGAISAASGGGLTSIFSSRDWPVRLFRGGISAAVPAIVSGQIPLPPQYAWIAALLAGTMSAGASSSPAPAAKK